MGNYTATRTHIYVAGAIIYAAKHNTNETTIYTNFNASIHATTGHTHTGATGDAPLLPASSSSLTDAGGYYASTTIEGALQEIGEMLTPIGSIIAFYDFGATVTFDVNRWKYCDGTNVSEATSPLNGLTTPDLSNRYLVGFGTEAGGDMDTALWATTVVGLASHQANLAHTHTVDSHTHGMQSHTHDVDIASFTSGAGSSHTHADTFSNGAESSHTHDDGSFYACLDPVNADGYFYKRQAISGFTATGHIDNGDVDVADTTSRTSGISVEGTSAAGSSHTHTISGSVSAESSHTHPVDPGNTTSGAPSNNTTTGTSPATDGQLSATQNVQPRSIRVRWIMRIL